MKKIWKYLFVILFVFTLFPEKPKVVFAQSSPEGDMKIELDWLNHMENDNTYYLYEDCAISNSVGLRISYSSEGINSTAFQAEELIIKVKGIGQVHREQTLKAIVGANSISDEQKDREWSYTWNEYDDTYIFTNNFVIPANTVISGYFELIWEVNARGSIHGYTQKDIVAELLLPNGRTIQSETVYFNNRTEADEFSVELMEHWLYSDEGLTEGITDPKQYIYIKYQLDSIVEKHSRGLSEEEIYQFCVDENSSGDGVILIDPENTAHPLTSNLYQLSISMEKSMSERVIYVLYPKENYLSKEIQPSIKMYGKYYEGNDEGISDTLLLAECNKVISIPAEFEFIDYPGYLYEFKKDTYYDKHVNSTVNIENNGDISRKKLIKGTTEVFYLEGSLYVAPSNSYSLEIVDDYLYALQKDGSYGLLKDEYSFEKIIIPGTKSLKNTNGITLKANQYPVSVFAYQNNEEVSDSNGVLIYENKLMQDEKTVVLPENTTAIRILIDEMTESITSFTIPVYVHFQISEEHASEVGLNIQNGKLINTSFLRLSDKNGNYINTEFTEENYLDQDTNLNLAQKDMDIYGMYLDREKDDITIYENEKCNYNSYTAIDSLQYENNNAYAFLTIGADFKISSEDELKRFSIYTILPENSQIKDIKNENQFWDIAYLEGFSMEPEQLSSFLELEIISNYKSSGRQYLAIHFNGDQTVNLEKNNIRIQFPVSINMKEYAAHRGTIDFRSCVLLDQDSEVYTKDKQLDDGIWSDMPEIALDIDQDEDKCEYLSSSYDYVSYVYAASSEFQITKYVKTEYETRFKQLPECPLVSYEGNYIYRLKLKNGYNKSKNIVITDRVEESDNSVWKGSLEKVVITGDELKKTDYSVSAGKSLIIDFNDFILDAGQEIVVELYMRAPSDSNFKEEITENRFSVQLTMEDLISGTETKYDSLESNPVQVKLTAPLRTITLYKIDKESGSPLTGAEFVLVNKETGKEIKTKTSNIKGYAVWTDIPEDVTYEIHEINAPKGYVPAEPVEIQFQKKDIQLTVENARKKGTVQVIKCNRIDEELYISGAQYGLFDSSGQLIQTSITDVSGMAEFTDISWGDYYVTEIVPPTGYQLNSDKYSFSINAQTVDEIKSIYTSEIQNPILIEIVKYETLIDGTKTETPIKDCVFELYRYKNNKTISCGTYASDLHGYIQIYEELPYGKYLLKEKRCPSGYAKSDPVEFTISPEKNEVKLSIYNQRKPGSILLIKKDNLGNIIQNVQYELYDEKKEQVLYSGITDEYGNIEWDNLEWGTYYLKEKSAPECYSIDLEWIEVVIDAEHLHRTMDCINETKKGTVQLIKTDETGTLVLQDAVFDLYTSDGKLIDQELCTDTKGCLEVSDLEWGSYYFLETKAPAGYVCNDEQIRFAVNRQNAGYTQKITVSNAVNEKIVSVTKTIKSTDINQNHGLPVFIFRLEGTDMQGISHTYYRMIAFSDEALFADDNNTEYVSKTVTFSGIPAGNYQLIEEETSRYYLKEIINLNNCTCIDNIVYIDLNLYDAASVELVNEKYEHQGLSDAVSIANILKPANILTGIKVKWSGEVYAGGLIDRNQLEVTAFYDDGSIKSLEGNEYVLENERFPVGNGDYEINITYTERNISQSASFGITISDGVKIPKHLEINSKNGKDVYVGSELNEKMFEVTAVYSDGSKELLTVSSIPELIQDQEQAVTISSPNWPSNYPYNMSLDENFWEMRFEGADAVKIIFDSTSQLQSISNDYICVKDDTGIPALPKIGGSYFASESYMVYGDYIHLSMFSDNSIQKKGFQAQLIPCYYEEPISMSYRLSTRRVPSDTGEFDLKITMEIPGIDSENWPTSAITLNAVERPMMTFYLGSPNKSDVTANLYRSGLLQISGAGNTKVYTYESALPWSDYKECIKTVLIEEDVDPTVMDYWFYNCMNLQSINNIPDCVTSLKQTFSGCALLQKAPELPMGIQNMQETFKGCSTIEEAPVIPDSVCGPEGLKGTFNGCLSLTTTPDLPDMYAGSLDNLFDSCEKLTDAPVIPQGVTSMSETFKKCKNVIEPPEIPPLVTSMKQCFYMCQNLIKAPDIPASVTDLYYTFYDCKRITETPQVYSTADWYYTFYYCTGLVSVTIPDGITSVEGAFASASGLINMPIIPESVTNISKTFYYCTNLTVPTNIPKSVTKMDTAFAYCYNLEGTMGIHAEPEVYADCFKKASRSSYSSGLVLTGTSAMLEELMNTKSTDSVIEIS